MSYTNDDLQALLSHPDAYVRSLADQARQTRFPWYVQGQGLAPYRTTDALTRRLESLARAGLVASAEYYV